VREGNRVALSARLRQATRAACATLHLLARARAFSVRLMRSILCTTALSLMRSATFSCLLEPVMTVVWTVCSQFMAAVKPLAVA
jgi:hypothetical protein